VHSGQINYNDESINCAAVSAAEQTKKNVHSHTFSTLDKSVTSRSIHTKHCMQLPTFGSSSHFHFLEQSDTSTDRQTQSLGRNWSLLVWAASSVMRRYQMFIVASTQVSGDITRRDRLHWRVWELHRRPSARSLYHRSSLVACSTHTRKDKGLTFVQD